jgi:hypothetical protein
MERMVEDQYGRHLSTQGAAEKEGIEQAREEQPTT